LLLKQRQHFLVEHVAKVSVFGTGSTPWDASRGSFLIGAGSTRSSMVRPKRDEHEGLYRSGSPKSVIPYVLCVARCIA